MTCNALHQTTVVLGIYHWQDPTKVEKKSNHIPNPKRQKLMKNTWITRSKYVYIPASFLQTNLILDVIMSYLQRANCSCFLWCLLILFIWLKEPVLNKHNSTFMEKILPRIGLFEEESYHDLCSYQLYESFQIHTFSISTV